MAEVLLFHAAQGQTPGFHAFADELRATGHSVHAPDLFGGRTFSTIEEGMAYAEELGFPDEILDRGRRAAERCRANSSTPASRSASSRRRSSPRPVPVLGAHSSSTRACRPSSSARGRRTSRPRSTAWRTTPCSPARATSTRPVTSSPLGTPPSCSSTRAISTTSRTRACPRTTPPRAGLLMERVLEFLG
jgi:hypothetical protein